MTKDQKDRFDEGIVKASEMVPNSDLDSFQRLQLIQTMTSNTVFIDIARQITIANEYRESTLTVYRAIAESLEKIANPLIQVGKDGVMRPVPAPDDEFIELPDSKGDTHHFHRHDLRHYRDGWFDYKPMGGIRTPLSAKEIKAIIESPTPPDALVEAVKEAIHLMKNEFLTCINNDCKCREGFGLCTQCKEAIYSFIVKQEQALAAHKKAGKK